MKKRYLLLISCSTLTIAIGLFLVCRKSDSALDRDSIRLRSRLHSLLVPLSHDVAMEKQGSIRKSILTFEPVSQLQSELGRQPEHILAIRATRQIKKEEAIGVNDIQEVIEKGSLIYSLAHNFSYNLVNAASDAVGKIIRDGE